MEKVTSIVKEWYFPESGKSIRKTSKDNGLFYVVRLHKGRERFLKIGTTERTITQRFNAKDYKKYTSVKFLYVAEISRKGSNPFDGIYEVEDLTRVHLMNTSGFSFVKNDRFRYFQLPEKLPIRVRFDEIRYIPTRKGVA